MPYKALWGINILKVFILDGLVPPILISYHNRAEREIKRVQK